MDLFDYHRQEIIKAEAPLAARMRPRTLDEFVGQDAIVGPGRLLRRAIQADQLSSVIFYGPPGTGKTTLARIIANTTKGHFIAINAVLAGVKEIRAAIATAQEKQGLYRQRTILFVDEVHRFNKAQQDALLPWVENGTVILIGATTENPYFEVNKALVSRSRIFQLKPLDERDLRRVVQQALGDRDRGYGNLQITLDENALNHLVNVANGDARALLNALELAIETTQPNQDGLITITLAVAEESIQRRAVLYDKEGDAHFDTISAFIKSVRGSDPDAALYWLARMVYAGEDPRFILRRLLILAGEDIGLADPQAIVVINACAAAFDRIGMPEGRYPLAQATLYLATAPKSNSVMGFFDALSTIEQEREAEVPTPLRDASRDKKGFGHGAGYLYPHAYQEHWVEQQYLPTSLQGQVFYQPSGQGYEAQIQTQVAQRREAQLATMVEGMGLAVPETLTFSPTIPTQERWLQRTLGQVGEQMAFVRDRIFTLANLQRHSVVLDLNARSGLLTWEAIRQVPEGGVYACVYDPKDAAALTEQSRALPELNRPVILSSSLAELSITLTKHAASIQFDCVLGRNTLPRSSDPLTAIEQLAELIRKQGSKSNHRSNYRSNQFNKNHQSNENQIQPQLVLAETIPHRAQRLYQLLNPNWLDIDLYNRLADAEEAIYNQGLAASLTLDVDDLETMFHQVGFAVTIQIEPLKTELLMTQNLIDRWFGNRSTLGYQSTNIPPSQAFPSYAEHLRECFTEKEVSKIQNCFIRYLCDQRVRWNSAIALISGTLISS